MIPDWHSMGYRYFPLGLAMRHEFGCAVWKVSVDARFSCPNIDGTVGTGGCLFCNTHSFAPSRRLIGTNETEISVRTQIDEGIRQLRRRYSAEKFLAYFQPSTNTYAKPSVLERVYREAVEHPEIVGLAIGTRPDALPDDVLDFLAEFSRNHWIQLELGLQSIHQKSLDFLRRGHDYPTFLDAVKKIERRGIRLGVHLILGIPGEDRSDVLATAREMSRLPIACLKIHNLYVVRDTPLAEWWKAGTVRLPELAEYAEMVVDFLELQPHGVVIDRISGEASGEYLLAPDWARIKHSARNAVDREFRNRNTFQSFAVRKNMENPETKSSGGLQTIDK